MKIMLLLFLSPWKAASFCVLFLYALRRWWCDYMLLLVLGRLTVTLQTVKILVTSKAIAKCLSSNSNLPLNKGWTYRQKLQRYTLTHMTESVLFPQKQEKNGFPGNKAPRERVVSDDPLSCRGLSVFVWLCFVLLCFLSDSLFANELW